MAAIKEKCSTIHLEFCLKNISRSSGSLTPPTLTAEEEARTWKKIDMKLMPILALLYLFSFLDRGNIGLAKLQGLAEQLELTGNRYNIALSMFYVPYCLFEFPSNLVLKKFRPSRWLPGITVLWGVAMLSMGFVKTHQQFIGARICLGFAEAGLFPGVIYYLTLWYPRHKLQYRIALFFGAASVSGAFSGILAYGISFMSGTAGKLGWSWIFILEGCATIVVGIFASFVMVDFPSTANFLTPEEKRYVVWRKTYDTSPVGEEEQFDVRYIAMAVTDWQLWLHILLFWSIQGPISGISLFLPSIIHGFGYSAAVSSLLTIPPYIVATVVLLLVAHFSDSIRLRWPFILAGFLSCIIGFSINILNAPIGAKYFGTFLCVAGSYSVIPGVLAWFSGNFAGQYKRAVAVALYNSSGNLFGIISTNVYRAEDAPRYRLGHGVELGLLGIGLIVLPITVFAYNRVNARRDAIMREAGESGGLQYTDEELRRMGDKAPNFRYGI